MAGPSAVYRHSVWVRVAHWINVVCMAVLLMNGLQISTHVPTSTGGDKSVRSNPLVIIGAAQNAAGQTTSEMMPSPDRILFIKQAW